MSDEARTLPNSGLATPTPWRVEEGTDLIWGACHPDDQSTYGMGYSIVQGKSAAWKPYRPNMVEREANAALIVEAVNSYASLKARIQVLTEALRSIQKATVDGRVCDDVAWFDSITTLYDYCDLALNQEK